MKFKVAEEPAERRYRRRREQNYFADVTVRKNFNAISSGHRFVPAESDLVQSVSPVLQSPGHFPTPFYFSLRLATLSLR